MASSAAKMLIPTILAALRGKKAIGNRAILQEPIKILLVKQSERLGNIVLMNSGISAIAAAFPKAGLDLLLPASFADVMAVNRMINRIIPIEKRTYIFRPWRLLRLLREIRSSKYDLAIDCSDVNSHSSTGSAYTLLSGAHLTAGWKMKARPIYDIEVSPFAETIHAGEMYERLFSGVFGRELEGRPYFDMPPSPENESSRIVGINCGGRGSKRWPLDSFIEVGQRLASEGYEIEFILGPDEAHLRQGLERSLPDGCRLLPYLPLPELMSKMRAHQLFISSDTGPMHLAWCLGVPVIAIFIDSELPKFKPLSAGSEALDGKSGLSPQIVVEKALSILKSRSVPA